MFGTNKTKDSDQTKDISAKMHTMSDDIAGTAPVKESERPVISTQKMTLDSDSPFSQKNNPVKEKKVPEVKAVHPEKPTEKEAPIAKQEKPKFFGSGPFLKKNPIDTKRESVDLNKEAVENTPLREELPKEVEPARAQESIRPKDQEKPREEDAIAVRNNFFPKIENEPVPQSSGGNFFPKIDPKPTSATTNQTNPPQNQNLFRKDELTSLEGFDDLNEYEGRGSGFFVYLFMFLIILILGGGGYYVLVAKEGELPQDYSWSGIMTYIEEDIEKSKILIDKTVGEDVAPPKPVFSEKTNFLVVKTGELTKDGINNLINNKFLEMKDYQGDQLEFLMVDEKNAPIKFENFANSFGMVLDRKILDNANGNFSIFLSQKDGINRMGLAINIKEKEQVIKTLNANEAILLQNLSSILLNETVAGDAQEVFADSAYRDLKIRYLNLSSDSDLSIDYLVVGNYLVFATSKDSGRLIIDRMLGE